MARRAVLVGLLAALVLPGAARANGDPASDFLLVQSSFLPFNAKIDAKTRTDLSDTITAADKKKYKVKVAVIGSRYDLGTAFSLYNQAQKYARFLGLELSFQFKDHLLVVMPNGYGVSIAGKPDPAGAAVVRNLPPPGKDATKQVEGATNAIRKLAAAAGHTLPPAGSGGDSSTTRDRITIAAAALALAAVLAAIVFWRRGGSRPQS